MKVFKRILAFSAAIAILLTGCSGSDTTWVYELEGERIPAGVYISYQMQAFEEAQSKVQEANADNEEFTLPEKVADIAKLELEGTTVEAWANQRAQSETKSYYVVQREAARLGVSLSADESASLLANVDAVWGSFGSQLEEVGISKNSYNQYQQTEILRSRVFDALYNAGGEREVPESDLKALFSSDYAKADVLMISKLTSVAEGEDLDAKNAERKALVESYLERLQNGEPLEDIDYDYRRETAADDAAKEAVTKKEAGALAGIYHKEDAAYYTSGLVDALFAASVGEPAMLEGEYQFYLYIPKDIMTDNPEDFQNYRATLIVAAKLDEFEAWLAGEADALTVTGNQPALDRYKIAKLQALYDETAAG